MFFRNFSSSPSESPDEADTQPLSELPIRILWGSQGGTARIFAQQLEEAIYEVDPERPVTIQGLHEVQFGGNDDQDCISILLVSVTGVGEPPDNARKFYEAVTTSGDDFSGLKYAVFGLGNATAHPNHFNVVGKAIDEKLAAYGSQRILPIGLGDDGGCIEDDFDEWMDRLVKTVTGEGESTVDGDSATQADTSESSAMTSPIQPKEDFPTMECPGAASKSGHRRISRKYPSLRLSPSVSHEVREDLFHLQGTDRQFYQDDTIGVEVIRNTLLTANAGESGLHEMCLVAPQPYETGDHLMMYPRNSQCIVEAYLNLLGDVDRHAIIEDDQDSKYPHPTGITVYETLSHCLDLGAIPSPPFARLLLGRTELDFKTEISDPRRTVLDLMHESGVRLSLEDFLYNMTPMRPRYYSIASSNICHPNEIYLTFRPVKYVTSRGFLREGVATSYLSHKGVNVGATVSSSSRVAAKVNSNPTFRLPKDPQVPILMIAGGCGVAPIRAFIEERLAMTTQDGVRFGPGLLYLGFRNQQDEVYRSLVDSALSAGALSHAQVAYAEGNCANTGQLTDLLRANSKAVWEHLEGGGHTYLCGGARTFGAAMGCELLNIVQEQGNMDLDGATNYMRNLASEGRLCEDLAD